tara:strand:- start:8 stop:487 length:480 start_codon:yes stop_codon:yes gene_type:complete
MFNDWYLDSPWTKMSLIGFVCDILDELIDTNKGDFSNGVYKVRTKYSDSKFYLDKVDGSFDESIHMLIHKIMYEENREVVGSNDPDEDLDCYYRMFIDSETFDEIDENPDSRWWVDSNHEDYEEIDKFLTDVYYECIHHVYSRLSLLGHDVEEQFDGYS